MNDNIHEVFFAINRLDEGDFAEAEAAFLSQSNFYRPRSPRTNERVQKDGRENLQKLHALRKIHTGIKQSKYWNAG